MNCCDQNSPPGGCRQGRDCPVDAAIVAARVSRTCEAVGICQHPERECTGACEQVPRVPAIDLYPLPDLAEAPTLSWVENIVMWCVYFGVGLLSIVMVLGVSGYLYARWTA